MKTVINAHWDDHDPLGTPGWYWDVREGRDIVDDSMKIWSEVNADAFAEDDGEELHRALADAYPDAEINVEGVSRLSPSDME